MSSFPKDDFDLMTQALFQRLKDLLPLVPPADRVEAVRMIREAMQKVLEEERENNTCSFCENSPTHTIGERAEYPWLKDDPICDECEKAHEEEEDSGDEGGQGVCDRCGEQKGFWFENEDTGSVCCADCNSEDEDE
jgi:hypothetical protein